MKCIECPHYKILDKYCDVNMFSQELSQECLCKLILQEIRFFRDEMSDDKDEGENWKI